MLMYTEKQQRFSDSLAEAVNTLNRAGLDYRMIGSLSLHGTIPELVDDADSTRRTWLTPYRDIDVIFSSAEYGRDRKGVKTLLNEFNRQHFPVVVDDTLSREGWLDFTDRDAHIRYFSYGVEVPKEVFDPYPVQLMGVDFMTIPPKTLLHISGVLGELRKEDRAVVHTLGRWLLDHPQPDYPDTLYEGFHDFYKGKAKKFPFQAWLRHAQHLKTENPNDLLGNTYKSLPKPVRDARWQATRVALWLEGHIAPIFW